MCNIDVNCVYPPLTDINFRLGRFRCVKTSLKHHLCNSRALNQDVSVGTAIDALQSAIQKLKAGFDDFEIDLQKVRKRKLVDQGAISIYTTMFSSP